MTVLGCDPGDELPQLILPPDWAQNNTAVSVQGQCHSISLPEACLFGDCERNSHSQTIPPFGNRGFIGHGIYFEYTFIALTTAAKPLGRLKPDPRKWRVPCFGCIGCSYGACAVSGGDELGTSGAYSARSGQATLPDQRDGDYALTCFVPGWPATGWDQALKPPRRLDCDGEGNGPAGLR